LSCKSSVPAGHNQEGWASFLYLVPIGKTEALLYMQQAKALIVSASTISQGKGPMPGVNDKGKNLLLLFLHYLLIK
jgi:hypothetical protein